MKSNILFWVFVFQIIILPQNNFIEQITDGDFDARNPFIYKNSYGLNRELFFELHKNGFSNIYSIKYNSATEQFEDTVSLTTGTSLNFNPSFKPDIGLLYQTNQNGNWDIVLLPDSNGVWKSPRFLTNSLSDEVSPSFFETMSSWDDSARILFEREGKILYLSIEQDTVIEEVVFQNDSNVTYYNFTGAQTDIWGTNTGYYVYAIEDSSGYKKIVSKYKPFGGDWNNKTIVKDDCDCGDLSVQISDYDYLGLFYSDTTLSQRRFFVIQNPFSPDLNSELVELNSGGNLYSFDLYAIIILGKRSFTNPTQNYEPYFPYTFLVEKDGVYKVRADLTVYGFNYGADSLIQTAITKPSIAIGPLGYSSNGIVVYTVWEDSVNGHIQLFGTKKYLQVGAVENESNVSDFILYQNFPNPFNPNTRIEYKIKKASDVRFEVINILGEKVFEEQYGYQMPGRYNIDFSGFGLPSGIYFYSIITEENKLTRKMVLLK